MCGSSIQFSNKKIDKMNDLIKQKKAIVIIGDIELQEYIEHENQYWFCSGAI